MCVGGGGRLVSGTCALAALDSARGTSGCFQVRSPSEYASNGNPNAHNKCGHSYSDQWDGCEIGHIPGAFLLPLTCVAGLRSARFWRFLRHSPIAETAATRGAGLCVSVRCALFCVCVSPSDFFFSLSPSTPECGMPVLVSGRGAPVRPLGHVSPQRLRVRMLSSAQAVERQHAEPLQEPHRGHHLLPAVAHSTTASSVFERCPPPP